MRFRNWVAFSAACGLAFGAAPLSPAFAQHPAREPAFASHRGVYELQLDTRRSSRGVDAARGRIAFETSGSVCEGFTTNFRQVVDLSTGGVRLLMDVRTANFEEGDGSSFRFTSRSTENGQVREETDGAAARREGRVGVELTKPSAKRVDLDGATIFPTEHLRRILAAARAGSTILEVTVYDGSETGEKHYNTTTVIGRRIEPGVGELEAPARDARLAALARWPVTISYFEAGKDSPTPTYAISFELYENGVSRALVMDFNDFALRGVLTAIEWLPDGACPR